MWLILKRKKEDLTETHPKITQMLELSDKDFKVAIVTMLMDMKEDMLTINGKKGNLIREIENINKGKKIQE